MKKVMKIDKDYYKIGCECGDEDCEMTLFVDDGCFYLYGKLKAFEHEWKIDNPIKSFILDWRWRIKSIFSILFKGYIYADTYLIFKEDEHIKSIIKILNNLLKYNCSQKIKFNNEGGF